MGVRFISGEPCRKGVGSPQPIGPGLTRAAQGSAKPLAGSRPTERHSVHLCEAHHFARSSAALRRPPALSAVSCERRRHLAADRLIQTIGSQEPATGMLAHSWPLWRAETSRGGRAAPPVRRSSGSPRPLSQQTNRGLYGGAHGHRRAVQPQRALRTHRASESSERKGCLRPARITRRPQTASLRLREAQRQRREACGMDFLSSPSAGLQRNDAGDVWERQLA